MSSDSSRSTTTGATMGAAFVRAKGSANDHDLGLFAIGQAAPGPVRGAVGLYHLAWEVDRVEDLVEAREVLRQAGALVGQSDHGATKSLYGMDPDGNEFEVMWAVPHDRLGEVQGSPPVAPLDLESGRRPVRRLTRSGPVEIRHEIHREFTGLYLFRSTGRPS